MSQDPPCPFCTLANSGVIMRNDLAIATLDAYPVTLSHMLGIRARHFGSFFDAISAYRAAMLASPDSMKQRLQAEYSPAGYNIGINNDAAAGQTIAHLHIHLIPRYAGDQLDPRGCMRWVMPKKADYWSGADRLNPA